MSDPDAESNSDFDSSTVGFLYSVAIGASVGLVLLLVFSYLRTRVPDVFQVRALLNTLRPFDDFNARRVGLPEPRPAESFFGWIRPVFNTPESEVLNKVGLDAAVFLRTIRTFFLISATISVYALIVLAPVYGTASNKDLDPSDINYQNGLRIISLSNVPDSSARYWATVIGEIFVACVVVYYMTMDYHHFAALRRKYCSSDNPSNYSVVVFDIPDDYRTENAIRERFERIVPAQVASVTLIRESSAALKLQKKLDAAVTKREVAEFVTSDKGDPPKTSTGGPLGCFKEKVDAQSHWAEEQDRLADEIHDLGTKAKVTPSAIVVLSNKRAAALLVQANSATSATKWHIEQAPEPKAIHWPAMSNPGYQAEFRTLGVAVFIAVFTIFWSIPATAIAGLFSLSELSKNDAFSWAVKLLDLSPALKGLIEGLLPPVVMAVIISLIPTIFRMVVSLERIPSRGRIEVKTRDYFYMFTVYGVFFVFIIGAAFFQDIKRLTEDYSQIITMLANGIPGQGVYYASFILTKCLIPYPLALSGVVRVIVRWIFLKLAKTERQKRKARVGSYGFQFFRHSGFAMLVLFLGLVYSTLQPLVILCATVYFGVAFVTFRYMLLNSTYSEFDGAGELFTGTFWGVMIGLILKQSVVFVTLGLKKAPAPAIVCLIPTILTACVTYIVSKRFAGISDHGSILDLSGEGFKAVDVPSQYKTVYEQPAGKVTNYENLNGLTEPRDVYSDVEYGDGDAVDTVHSESVDIDVGYVPDRAADREVV